MITMFRISSRFMKSQISWWKRGLVAARQARGIGAPDDAGRNKQMLHSGPDDVQSLRT